MSRASSSARSITARFLRQVIVREVVADRRTAASATSIRPQLAANRPAQIVDQHEVIQHATLVVVGDAIEHLDHRADLDVEAGLLEHLAHDAGLERLADFDPPPEGSTARPAVRAALDEHAPGRPGR